MHERYAVAEVGDGLQVVSRQTRCGEWLLPSGFDDHATSWVLPRPVWGTCMPTGDEF